MSLVEMTTNLKSLRFGKDTVGGGNSAQPFVTRNIPTNLSQVGRTGGPDFLLRGGTLLPRIVANDAVRMSKLFYPGRGGRINTTDNSDPLGRDRSNNGRRPVNLIGTLFTAKQNILSLTNVDSGAGYEPFERAEGGSAIGDFLRNNIGINQGIYTPLSTIGQAVGNPLGAHLNKQGLNPLRQTTVGSTDGNTPLGLPTYLNIIHTDEPYGERKSRLTGLLPKVEINQQGDPVLYSYSGGPGATLGVGRTTLNINNEYRTGENNVKKGFWESKITPQFVNRADINITDILKNSVYTKYRDAVTDGFYLYFEEFNFTTNSRNVYQPGTLLKTDTKKLASGINDSIPQQVFTQKQIENKEPFSKTGKGDDITDFRKEIAPNGSDTIPNTLPYTSANKFEQRVNLGNPGVNANRQSYTIGRRDLGSTIDTVSGNADYTHALDKVNALPIYKSSAVAQGEEAAVKNDFVKFRIGVIDNRDPSKKTYVHFRAIIDSMSDNYSADWSEINYMGRGEKFYKYKGFDRNISLTWTVAAQSKQELIPMYQKLNYLASVTAPYYSDAGYMGGNLITLTIGGWCYEQPGIMKGIQLGVPQESPWEISIPDADNISRSQDGAEILTDPSVKEMPMIVKVTGFEFKPIHNFVPKVQSNRFAGKAFGGGNFASSYGNERYIALANEGGVNNYSGGLNSKSKHINYLPKK